MHSGERKAQDIYIYYKCKLNKLVKFYYSGMWDQFTDEVAMVSKSGRRHLALTMSNK